MLVFEQTLLQALERVLAEEPVPEQVCDGCRNWQRDE